MVEKDSAETRFQKELEELVLRAFGEGTVPDRTVTIDRKDSP